MKKINISIVYFYKRLEKSKKVAFWGAVASIVALPLTLLTVIPLLVNNGSKTQVAEKDPLKYDSLLEYITPSADLSFVQSKLGPHYRSGEMDGFKFWSYLFDDIYLVIESIDGVHVSEVKLQLRSLYASRVFNIPGTDFILGVSTLNEPYCEDPPTKFSGSRGTDICVTFDLASNGVCRKYAFGVYSGYRSEYEDKNGILEAAFDLNSSESKVMPASVGRLKANYIVISRCEFHDPGPIDWEEYFDDWADADAH